MLRVNDNKGFHIEFDNGLTISVQFGYGNYCDNRDIETNKEQRTKVSTNAEIAIWDKNNNWYVFDKGDTVKGWVTANEIGIWIDKVRRAKNIKSIKGIRNSAKEIKNRKLWTSKL